MAFRVAMEIAVGTAVFKNFAEKLRRVYRRLTRLHKIDCTTILLAAINLFLSRCIFDRRAKTHIKMFVNENADRRGMEECWRDDVSVPEGV